MSASKTLKGSTSPVTSECSKALRLALEQRRPEMQEQQAECFLHGC
jgi:hypothetical protein